MQDSKLSSVSFPLLRLSLSGTAMSHQAVGPPLSKILASSVPRVISTVTIYSLSVTHREWGCHHPHSLCVVSVSVIVLLLFAFASKLMNYSLFLFKRQSAPSVLSKESRAGNAEDPIQKTAHWIVFLLQSDILLLGHFE